MNEQNGVIAQLYQTCHYPLLMHLLRLISNREIAEDLCQETFVRALRHWSQRDPTASAKAWLYRIATNVAYDHLRRRRRIDFVALDQVDVPASNELEIVARLDRTAAVGQALAKMSPAYRLPLLLACYADRDTAEISHVLGCSRGTVRMRLCRARAQFREVYQAHHEERGLE
ncbi:MAG: RNA polymerase sigma factor [Chloroflexales bacterium]|nr:RNA polymerase sigma factor [Chloroflexales bacterium]